MAMAHHQVFCGLFQLSDSSSCSSCTRTQMSYFSQDLAQLIGKYKMQNYPNKKTFGLDKHFLTPGTADNTLQVI